MTLIALIGRLFTPEALPRDEMSLRWYAQFRNGWGPFGF